MPYASASDVAALCINILAGASNFSASTEPTLAQVEAWLEQGQRIIDARLESLGYSASVPSSVNAYGLLAHLNTLYAAAMVEMARTNISLAPGERTRGQVFWEMFETGLAGLTEENLAGLTIATTAAPYLGGISLADIDAIQADSDWRRPRFVRDQFRFGDAARPKNLIPTD